MKLGCPKHPHAYRIGSECSECWAAKRRATMERYDKAQISKAHPQHRERAANAWWAR